MTTMQQALDANEFHVGACVKTVGPRGGVQITQEIWRRNGRNKLWKTRPTEFQVPIKHGLKHYGYINDSNAHAVHTLEDCPIKG